MLKKLLKGRPVLYIILLLHVIGLMVYLHYRRSRDAAPTPTAGRDYPEIRREGTLRLLTAYTEGGVHAEGGELTGAVYTLAKKLQERSGIRVEVILENSWERALQLLSEGGADLVVRPMASTADVDTTRFLLFGQQTSGPLFLVQRRADSTTLVKRQIELAGRMITLPKGSPFALFIEHLSEEIGDSIHLDVDTLYQAEQLAMRVASGKIAYTVCTHDEAKLFSKAFPELDCSIPLSYSFRTAWLLRHTSLALRDSLSVWMAR
jgi:probable glutamine ABC transporter